MRLKQQRLSGWGRFPSIDCICYRPEKLKELSSLKSECIARGQGKSYGDAALNDKGDILLTERINRFISFDQDNGVIALESGVILSDLFSFIIPKGWFLPSVPGTASVSIGGCIAADIHGKNQHQDGNFAQSLIDIQLITANGETLVLSANNNPELFKATIGGMGLTGVIKSATIKLKAIESSYVIAQNYSAENLQDLFTVFEQRKDKDIYSVAWLDCLAKDNTLGRGIYTSGYHAQANEIGKYKSQPLHWQHKNKKLPFTRLLSLFLNRFSAKLFNQLYFKKHSAVTEAKVQPLVNYFFPLDKFNNWNALYGSKGFIQYQCVIAETKAYEGVKSILETLQANKITVFLAVLKRFKDQDSGFLSFPMAGYTLAIDIPVKTKHLFDVLNQLDKIVIQHKGKVYLAKDARLNHANFIKMYPLFSEWEKIKQQHDPDCIFNSALYERLIHGKSR